MLVSWSSYPEEVSSNQVVCTLNGKMLISQFDCSLILQYIRRDNISFLAFFKKRFI